MQTTVIREPNERPVMTGPNFPDVGNAGVDLYLNLLKRALSASLYEESAWEVLEETQREKPRKETLAYLIKSFLRRIVVRQLRRRSLALVRMHQFNPEMRQIGKDWPLFGFSMIGQRRLDHLQECIEDVLRRGVPGDFIETGAWRGGATILMRALLKAYGDTQRIVWVADSFEGLPKPKDAKDGWDFSHVDHLKVSLEQVKANFAKFNLLDEQVHFLQGWFEATLPTAPIGKLAILRLDGDLYSSTMDVLTNLYSKVAIGGYVIVDDYYSWPACRQAVHDFLEKRNLRANIQPIDSDAAFWRKEDV